MIAGLLLSVSAFSQTPEGAPIPYPTSGQTIQYPAEKDKAAVNPRVKFIMNRMLAARVFHSSSNVEEPHRAYFLYPTFAGPLESVFSVDNREIPGRVESIPVRLYPPNMRTGLPLWMFLHGGGFVTGGLDAYDVPLRAATNRRDYPVVSAGYPLAPENRYHAAPEDTHAADIDRNPTTLLLATPPGTFGLQPIPGLPQTPIIEANRAGGNIDPTTLVAHFRAGLWFRRLH